jgi:predicted site-specific integrase-resolvase
MILIRLGAEPQGADHPDRKTVADARVSSHDQKDDVERQNRYWNSIVPVKAGRLRSWPTWDQG